MKSQVALLLALTAASEAFWFHHPLSAEHHPHGGWFPLPWYPGHQGGQPAPVKISAIHSTASTFPVPTTSSTFSAYPLSFPSKASKVSSSKISVSLVSSSTSPATSSIYASSSKASVPAWSGPTVNPSTSKVSLTKISATPGSTSSGLAGGSSPVGSSSKTSSTSPKSSAGSSSKSGVLSLTTTKPTSIAGGKSSASTYATSKSSASTVIKSSSPSYVPKSSTSTISGSAPTRVSTAPVVSSPLSFTTKVSSSPKSLSSPAKSSLPVTSACTSTTTRYFTVTATPTTTITYEIDHGTDTINGDDFATIPQFEPSTVYPSTVYTIAATSTATVIVTPTTTIGSYVTVHVPTPSGFRNIQDTLPGWSDEGLGSPDPANKKRQAGCVATVYVTTTTYAATTLTATTVTTLTGVIYAFPEQTTTFDQAGGAIFASTHTDSVTLTVTTPRTITTSYQTTVTTTVMLPLQTVTGATTSIYEVCRTQNQAIQRTDAAVPTGALYLLTNTAMLKLDGYFGSAYDCCAAAVEFGGVAFWQYNPLGCQVQRIGVGDNDCVQGDYKASVNFFNAHNASNVLSRLTGNGLCGQVNAAVLYPAAGTGTGGD